jgi:alcohol dehydrogenase (cytochrome c)
MKARNRSALLILAAALVPLFGSTAIAQISDYKPVTNDEVLNPPAEDWLMWRGTLDNQGYSALDQINRDNVGDLRLAWAWPMPITGLQEIAPLVRDGVMFLGENRNVVQALDAVTGDLIWEYRHMLPTFEGGYHDRQADRQKNTIVLYEDRVILTTADAKIVSLDAATGQVVWEVQVNDWEKGYSYTAGPLVVNGMIFSATSGCSMTGTAGGCYITGHDFDTGEEMWRINTLDDPNNPAVGESWAGLPVENRWGGSPWITGSYDPELNLLFWGVGMPIPYPEIIRGSVGGDTLYTNSTLAINADTGEIVWYYQHLPRDDWDLDSPFERVLVDTAVAPNADDVDWMSDSVEPGREYKVVVSVPGKYGTAFVLDRETGEPLWIRDTVYQNVISGYTEDGRVITNIDLISTTLDDSNFVCGGRNIGKLWQAGSYSPLTNAFYVPISESCTTLTPRVQEFLPGESVGAQAGSGAQFAPGSSEAGHVYAIDVATGDFLWVHQQREHMTSSTLTTGGGLVFSGDAARRVRAHDQDTGEVLWETRLNSTIGGHPMTYMVDGVQYVVIPTGTVTQAGGGTNRALYPETPVVSGGNSIFVFRLGNLD